MNAQQAHSVLIVEDERVIAKDIQQTLQGMGYDAFAIASSAKEALARVAERCPDLVLMDIRIEGSQDGIEAAKLLSALHDVPVIFLSAHADEATLERAKKVGPYGFLAKPVKAADLRGAIETSLYRQAMDRQLRSVARQLEISDRLAALGTMAAGTAHELNNPLAIITGRVENALDTLRRHVTALESGALPDGWSAQLSGVFTALADVQTAAGRMSRIISEMRSISRPQHQAPQVIDPARCIDWAKRATAHEFHNRARVILRLGPVPKILADEGRLGQVLVNLLVNAAHAIAPGDFEHNEVVIATRTDESRRAVISVHDTGHGMTPDVVKRIFDPFYTTKDVGAGTGLGLAVSHGIVTSLGGILRAESTPGTGSTFEVILPPAPAATSGVACVPANEPTAKAVPRKGRILVVDDEEVLLRAITEILEYDDLEVVTSNNARDALAMITRGERFDVILSDLAMPNMTGMEFFDALEALDANLAQRMLFMSGGAVTAKADDFLNSLAKKCIAKPFKSAELRAVIQQALAAKTPQLQRNA